MDPQEIRDKIMAAINGIIKDEPDTANSNLHDVLAAKMRNRMNPDGTTADDSDDTEITLDDPSSDDEPTVEASEKTGEE